MPRGDKSRYTDKQERMAEHIEDGYEKRGVRAPEAKRRAWATVNKTTGGGRKPGGSGRGKATDATPARTGGKRGGKATAKRGGKATPAKRAATKRTSTRRAAPARRAAPKRRAAKR